MTIRTLLRCSLFLLSAILICPSFSQSVKLKTKVVLAPDPPGNEKRPIGTVLELNDRALLVSRVPSISQGIQRYSEGVPLFEMYDRTKMFQIRTIEPQLRAGSAPLFFDGITMLGADPVMFASRRDTALGTTQLYWQKLDPNMTIGHRPFELLCAFDTKVYGDGTKLKDEQGYRDPFMITRSPDKKHVLVYSPAVNSVKGETYCAMVMVDQNMKLVWKQTLELPSGARFQDMVVDVNGDVLFMERNGMAVKDMKKDTTTYSLLMHRVNGKGVVDVDLGLGKSLFAKDVAYHHMPDSTILMAGLYSGMSGKETPTLGDYIGRIPLGANALKVISKPTLTLNADDASYTNNAIRMGDVLPSSDGGYFMVREYFQETDAVDAKTAMSGLRWIHGPLVVTKVDDKGSELWTTTFRRLQYATDPEVGEVFSMVYKDQLLLLLVDCDEQTEMRKSGNSKLSYLNFKSPYTTTVQFDTDGKDKAKNVLRSSGANDFVVGKQMWHLGPDEYFFSGSHKLSGSRTQLIRVDIASE